MAVQEVQGGPCGSLTIVYLSDVTVWTGDTRHFLRCGEEQFRAAWDWLAKGKDRWTLSVHKDYQGDRRYVEYRDARPEEEALARAVSSTYAGPDVPGWKTPGIHLAKHIRLLLWQAHDSLAQEGPVFSEEFEEAFASVRRQDFLLGRIADRSFHLWPSKDWLPGLEIKTRKPWRYVKVEKRRLAKKYRRNILLLLAELKKEKLSPSRRNTVLSELADIQRLPEGYVSPRKAYMPFPQCLGSCGREIWLDWHQCNQCSMWLCEACYEESHLCKACARLEEIEFSVAPVTQLPMFE